MTQRTAETAAPRQKADIAEQPQLTVEAEVAATEQHLPRLDNAPEMTRGALVHTPGRGDTMPGLVRRFLPASSYMRGSELEAAIRAANPGVPAVYLKAGIPLQIPSLDAPTREHPLGIAKDFEVRAIYLTGIMAGSARGLELVRRWRSVGGNAVVFDIKDSDGVVNIPFTHELNVRSPRAPMIRNLAKYTHWLHEQGMVAIGRVAIFRDERMAVQHPELAIQSRRNSGAWRENGKQVWVDPSRREVQEFNLELARLAAQAGVDEIQFDYVRFPAEGDQGDARFAFESERPNGRRSDVITDFVARAHREIKPLGVLFSLDVFGVVAWQRPVDIAALGQDIPRMAEHCDVLSPMIYPSHFFGMDGYAMPGDAPEHFIGRSMDRFREITAGSGVVLRPWLQAFGWRTKTYSPEYVQVQVKVAREKHGVGFLLWNARNDYGYPYTAMSGMQREPGRFFRGDEVAGERSRTARLVPASQRQE
ncbi:MAG: putative glycoside hydrolase [Candidatus Korobacteraceae bacterium]